MSAAPHQRLRVAIVAPSLRILGGQAVQAQRLIEAWQDDPDVEAWLVPINPAPPAALAALARVKYARTIVTQLRYWPLLLSELRRAHVVHVFSASYFSFILAPLPAGLVARLLRKPVLVNYRSGEAPDHLARSAIARTVLRSADRVVVPSRFLAEVMERFGIRTTVVSNIVDLQRFAFRRRDRLAPRLLSTRNFEPLYNVACTLRAFALIQARHPEATLTLVGDGSQQSALRALAVALGLRNVTFAGAVPPSDITRYYADADIYVQTPRIDNMPASILEAFASGLPVVATGVGGVPAILTHETHGLLVPDDDHRAVAEAVERLLDDRPLAARLAAEAYASCSGYRWEAVRDRWVALYRELAATGLRVGGGASRMSRVGRLWRRARVMSRKELAWRLATGARDAFDEVRFAVTTPRWRRGALARRLDAALPARDEIVRALRRGRWMEAQRALASHFGRRAPRFLFGAETRTPITDAILRWHPDAPRDARARADRIIEGRYDLLGYAGVACTASAPRADAPGIIPNWHADPVHRRRAPRLFWARVRYLDPAIGDHKVIWELNRHQHWLMLARAWWLTGERRYRQLVLAQLEDWLHENPPLAGINWTSMLELGFRSLSWIAALHLLVDDTAVGQAFQACQPDPDDRPWLVDLLLGLDRQLRHLEHHLSYYFSPNTHLTGEALALYVGGRVLPELRDAPRWAETGRRILLDEIARQIAPDGGHAERSMHYQRYTLDFYLLALAVARLTGDEAEPRFAEAAARLAAFTRLLADDNGRLPQIGDDDGGRLWPLAARPTWDVRDSLAVAGHLLGDPALRVDPTEVPEEAIWLTGGRIAPLTGTAALTPPSRSAALPDTGYVVSRNAGGDMLVFDAGAHGYLNGGHAHADALAVTVTLRGRPLFIDPGTGTYTMDPAVRDRMRATALHNTVTIDGRSASTPRGPFHWTTAADASLIRWRTPAAFDYAEGAHDGYAPRRHHRIVYRLPTGGWAVMDRVEGPGTASLDLHWHLDPAWTARRAEPHAIALQHADGARAWLLTTTPCGALLSGDESGLGWLAPVYGPLQPTTTIRCSQSVALPHAIVSLVLPDDGGGAAPGLDRIQLAPVPGACSAYAGAAVNRERGTDLLLAAVPLLPPGSETPATWPVETDARFLHVHRGGDGPALRLSMIDGTRVAIRGEGAFRVGLDRLVPELHVVVDPPALLLMSDAPLPPLEIETPGAQAIDRVLINGGRASVTRRGGHLYVDGISCAAALPSNVST